MRQGIVKIRWTALRVERIPTLLRTLFAGGCRCCCGVYPQSGAMAAPGRRLSKRASFLYIRRLTPPRLPVLPYPAHGQG